MMSSPKYFKVWKAFSIDVVIERSRTHVYLFGCLLYTEFILLVLEDLSFPDEIMGATLSDLDRVALVEEATYSLRASGQTALLEETGIYQPISTQLLNKFLENLLRLFERVKASDIQWRTLSPAASFLPEDRFVIWDFFPPAEHDTKDLCRL
jgi:hypothetical protein